MVKFSNCQLFSGLSAQELKQCETYFRVVNYPWQSSIFQEGDVGGAMYFINQGKVKIGKKGKDGRDIILAELGEGDFFGEMSLLDDKPRSAFAVAITDTFLSQLTKDNFIRLLNINPNISFKLLQSFSKRLRETNDLISSIQYKHTEERLADLLSSRQEMEFSPEQLAVQVESTPEAVNQILLKFQREGMITISQYKLHWIGKQKKNK
ncbi:MAG: Crp/Fnr family transcriptional regulator [Bacillota bacterium]